MTITWHAITLLLEHRNGRDYIPVRADLRIQVFDGFNDLRRVKIHQCAAFIARENMLVVWDDEPKNLLKRAHKLVDDLCELVWNDPDIFFDEVDSKLPTIDVLSVVSSQDSPGEEEPNPIDIEVHTDSARPYMVYNAVYVSITIAAVLVFIGFGLKTIIVEAMGDKTYIRFALILMIPIQVFFSLFFFQVIVGCVAQCIGPIKQMNGNSRFYSGKPPKRLTKHTLPHVTIQCPGKQLKIIDAM